MAEGLILLTGATGHVGYRTLVEALRAGYEVRAAVRRESSIAQIEATASIQPFLGTNKLTFAIVEDITIDGAFDEAIKGVDYVVHIASPLAKPAEDVEKIIIQPAIQGTLSILYSALKEPSVKRVVITASTISVTPMDASPDTVVTPDFKAPDPIGPYPHFFVAYGASKVLAYNRTLDFINEEQPSFSIINVMPSFVVGKHELANTPQAVMSGSNALFLSPILGFQNPDGLPAISVHVDDVAKVHIASLNPAIKGNHNFGANSNGVEGVIFDDAIDIVKNHFPKEVEKGVFPLGGSTKSLRKKFDASRTEEVFNFKFKSFEEQIVSVAAWYAEVAAKA